MLYLKGQLDFRLFSFVILIMIFNLLIKYIIAKLRIYKIKKMDGYEFEDYISNFFRKIGIAHTKTKKSKDFGADIVTKDSVIQLKNYSNKVPIKVLNEVKRAKKHYKKKKMVILTNNYFSEPMKKQAKKDKIILIDGKELFKIFFWKNGGKIK